MENKTKNIGATCLEKRGMKARQELLKQNKWYYYDNEYTKEMIDEEYNAFNVSLNSLPY